MPTNPNIALPIIETNDETTLGGPELLRENLWPERGKPQTGAEYTLHNPPGVDPISDMSALPGAAGPLNAPTGVFSREGIFDDTTIIFTHDQLFFEDNAFAAPNDNAGALAPVNGFSFQTNGSRSMEHASIRQFLSYIEDNRAIALDASGVPAPVANLPPTIIDVASIGKRFYWLDGGSDLVYFSDLDAATHNPLNFFSGEVISDQNASIYVHNNNLYISSSQITEIHRPVPDPNLPVAYTGTSLPFGAPCPASWADTLGLCFTIGQTENGARGVYRINGATYEKISPHWLDRRLEYLDGSAYPENSTLGVDLLDIAAINRCIGNAYTIEGHSVYELYIPGVSRGGVDFPPLSISYDATYRAWFLNTVTDVATPPSISVRPRFHGVSANDNRHLIVEVAANAAGDLIAADGRYGNLQREAVNYFDQFQPRRWCTFQPTDKVFQVDDVVQQMQFIIAQNPGTGTVYVKAPKATVNAAGGVIYDCSDDLGLTFQPERQITVNFHNKSGHYVSNRRGGEVRQPGRIHRMRVDLFAGNVEIGPMFINRGTLT